MKPKTLSLGLYESQNCLKASYLPCNYQGTRKNLLSCFRNSLNMRCSILAEQTLDKIEFPSSRFPYARLKPLANRVGILDIDLVVFSHPIPRQ